MTAFLVAVGCAACGDNLPSVPSEAGIDAPPPDARPAGIIQTKCEGQPGKPRILIYTYENTWRHYSNLDSMLAILNMCNTRGFTVLVSNDPNAINDVVLAQVDVVVFAVTSGPGMNSLAHRDLEAWVRAGGGIVGLHSAGFTEYDWTFYTDNIGVKFLGHGPGLNLATVKILPGAHPITDGMTDFPLTDEWYIFQSRPEEVPGMQMLLALDETTLPTDYPAQWRVGYHPIGWAHENYGGRVFYTALGHNGDDFKDPIVLELVGRAIEWAAHKR